MHHSLRARAGGHYKAKWQIKHTVKPLSPNLKSEALDQILKYVLMTTTADRKGLCYSSSRRETNKLTTRNVGEAKRVKADVRWVVRVPPIQIH